MCLWNDGLFKSEGNPVEVVYGVVFKLRCAFV